MRIDIFTTFPNMFEGPFRESIIARAVENQLVNINIHNIRDYTHDKHNKTDDEPYGHSRGMVMLAEPIIEAVESILAKTETVQKPRIVFLSPQGKLFSQEVALSLAEEEHLVLVCGHYKGIDQRAIDILQGEELSIGDYVLSGGEIPAMVVVDTVTRLLPGVVGEFSSVAEDSLFDDFLLEGPVYTRPREIRGLTIPEELLSGDHSLINNWRKQISENITKQRRPDLWAKYQNQKEQNEA